MSFPTENRRVPPAMTMCFKIVPRDVPASAVSRPLGISEAHFANCLADLLARGFPGPGATTGNFDLKAVEAWQDRRSGLSGAIVAGMAKDAGAVVAERLAAMRNGYDQGPLLQRSKGGPGLLALEQGMQAMGFPSSVPCGPDGPDAWKIAQEWNARWQVARTGREPAPKHVWPRGSLGEAFDRFRTTETWKTDKAHRTREDWERGWSHIAPIFGDLAPRTVTLEHIDAWYHALKVMKSVSEAHRAMKIWRALWNVAAAMHYCSAEQDPSFGIRRETPKGRSATWEEGEVVRLVKAAWRRKYHGLACIIAIAYDAQFAPVDSRSLCLRDSRDDGMKLWFEIDRAKTGRDALATLSLRTQALIRAYVATLPNNL